MAGLMRGMGPNIQGMNPRARMMLHQQRAQLPPGAAPPDSSGQMSPVVSQSSPLLAQHLSGRPGGPGGPPIGPGGPGGQVSPGGPGPSPNMEGQTTSPGQQTQPGQPQQPGQPGDPVVPGAPGGPEQSQDTQPEDENNEDIDPC